MISKVVYEILKVLYAFLFGGVGGVGIGPLEYSSLDLGSASRVSAHRTSPTAAKASLGKSR